MSLILALVSAVAYGCADFVGGLVSRRAAPWSVAFVALASGSLLLLVLAAAAGGDPTRADLAWGALAGVGGGLGTAFLYRGFASGRMGVIAPISGVGSAVVPVLVGVLLAGERPGVVVQVGLVLALPGIWLVSSEPRDPAGGAPDARRRLPPGVGDGVLAGLGFGTLFAALGQVPEEAGFLPLALHQVVAAAVVAAVGALLRQPWRPRERAAVAGLVPGVLGAAATGTYLVAAQGGLLSVTAVLASLYPAVTVILALTVLRERAHATQLWGLLLCGVAVALVAGG